MGHASEQADRLVILTLSHKRRAPTLKSALDARARVTQELGGATNLELEDSV
jgi:hypothetical protein